MCRTLGIQGHVLKAFGALERHLREGLSLGQAWRPKAKPNRHSASGADPRKELRVLKDIERP